MTVSYLSSISGNFVSKVQKTKGTPVIVSCISLKVFPVSRISSTNMICLSSVEQDKQILPVLMSQ